MTTATFTGGTDMSVRLTVFTDHNCNVIRNISELHGKTADRFVQTILLLGHSVECRTYRDLGIRIEEILER